MFWKMDILKKLRKKDNAVETNREELCIYAKYNKRLFIIILNLFMSIVRSFAVEYNLW